MLGLTKNLTKLTRNNLCNKNSRSFGYSYRPFVPRSKKSVHEIYMDSIWHKLYLLKNFTPDVNEVMQDAALYRLLYRESGEADIKNIQITSAIFVLSELSKKLDKQDDELKEIKLLLNELALKRLVEEITDKTESNYYLTKKELAVQRWCPAHPHWNHSSDSKLDDCHEKNCCMNK